MERVELESMKGAELISYADKLGVKVSCNKARTSLKESKAKVIDKIVAFETEHTTKEEKIERHLVPMQVNVDNKVTHKSILDYVETFLISLDIEFKRSVKCIRLIKNKSKFAVVYARKNSIRVYMNRTDLDAFNFPDNIICRVNEVGTENNFYVLRENIDIFLRSVYK